MHLTRKPPSKINDSSSDIGSSVILLAFCIAGLVTTIQDLYRGDKYLFTLAFTYGIAYSGIQIIVSLIVWIVDYATTTCEKFQDTAFFFVKSLLNGIFNIAGVGMLVSVHIESSGVEYSDEAGCINGFGCANVMGIVVIVTYGIRLVFIILSICCLCCCTCCLCCLSAEQVHPSDVGTVGEQDEIPPFTPDLEQTIVPPPSQHLPVIDPGRSNRERLLPILKPPSINFDNNLEQEHNLSVPPLGIKRVKKLVISAKRRPIAIDADNLCWNYGENKKYSTRGLELAITYFSAKGYSDAYAFIPEKRIKGQHDEVLKRLMSRGNLAIVPTKTTTSLGKVKPDVLLLMAQYASKENAVIISNNEMTEFANSHPELANVIDERRISFFFTGDQLMLTGDLNRGFDPKTQEAWNSEDQDNKDYIVPKPLPNVSNQNLRSIAIDAENVCMYHGGHEVYSCRGVELAVNYFVARGHTDVYAFVKENKLRGNPQRRPRIERQDILRKLEADRRIVILHQRRPSNVDRKILPYEDAMIAQYATSYNAIIISNDNMLDVANKYEQYRESIEKWRIPFCFAGDTFMIISEPNGNSHSSADDMLVIPPDNS